MNKLLSQQEEREIIESIYKNHLAYIGNGASRLVFEASQEIYDKYCDGHAAVIKVAVGQGGIIQNRHECDAYLEYGHLGYFATIYAYGQLVEIMEQVDTFECRDFLDFGDEEEEDFATYLIDDCGYRIEADDAYEFLRVAYALCDIFGYTGDNGQLGFTENGAIVAYDYGFYCDNDNEVQTSDLAEYLEGDRNAINHYLNILTYILNKQSWEIQAAVNKLESAICESY